MARHKEYDRDDVLDKAVLLFWQKGFKAASMADVVKATGLNTASMYKEFQGKEGLFEAALSHYRELIMAPRLQTLVDEPNIKGIEKFLQDVAAGAAGEDYKGCLMMNHLTQKHSINGPATELIEAFCRRVETLLEAALTNAQKNGEIAADKDPAMMAGFIMCFVHGLSMYGRREGCKERIADLMQMVVGTVS